MCGITGIISTSEKGIDAKALVEMTDTLWHRGPDGEGFLFTNASNFCDALKGEREPARIVSLNHRQHVAFGHRRLSILDLNFNAAQPMSYANERYWIVYNGEIYNHAELRKELESKGYKFLTDHSDTEVVLSAYDCWGIDCLNKFNGMWAFCIWDTKRNTFFLSRDRIGKTPLYYAETANELIFSSELKAFGKLPGFSKEINERAIYDYLTHSMVHSPGTIFSNIKKLPASHYIFFTPGDKIETKQYWSPFPGNADLDWNEDQIKESLREKLEEATRLRYMADVEVGALLSGGLDSSINLANIAKCSSKPLKTFSVGFENNAGYKNELKYARKVAEHFNADYHELVINENDFMSFIPEMAYYLDEPISDPASIPLAYISKLARKNNVKVLMSGEGSDELLVGYELWRLARQFANVVEGKPFLAKGLQSLHQIPGLKNKRQYYHEWYKKVIQGYPVFWSGTEIMGESEKKEILNKEFLRKLDGYNSFLPVKNLHDAYRVLPRNDRYNWMTSVDLLNRLPDLLLARLDRMAMAASVETRNPFLDINVVEFAMRIPPGLKNKGNQQKYILKKAYEGILPNEIIYRPKSSFPVPLAEIFRNKANRDVCISAFEQFNNETAIFQKDYIEKLKTTQDMSAFWSISTLALWYLKHAK